MSLSKNRKEFNEFIDSLAGKPYINAIVSKYPLAHLTFVPEKRLYQLEEDEVFCCTCGCGEVKPIMVPYPTLSVVSHTDGLEEAVIHGFWVSPCKQKSSFDDEGIVEYYDIEVFNDKTGEIVKVEINYE
ncbi:hypothetical protein [Escherichia phage vB_EcoM-LTH01]|nr:hypothetical protein [Escherichia phage UPEC06]